MPSMPKPTVARPFALCGSVVLPSMHVHLPAGIARPIARPLARRSLWFGGLSLDADACQVRSTSCGFFGSVVLPSMLMPTVARRSCASDCASSCSLWFGGLALDADAVDCASTCPQVFVDRWSCPRCRCLPVVLRVHLPAGLARFLAFARRSCASSGFPYYQKTALELQALAR